MEDKRNIFWIAIGTILILGFVRLYGFLHNTGYYWTIHKLHNLATISLKDESIVGLIITFSIPIVTGFVLVNVANRPLIGAATASGFLATLLQSWPILFFTNLQPHLIPSWLKGHPFKLFFLQALYIASYTILCRFGAMIASRQYIKKNTNNSISETKEDSAVRVIILGIVVCIVWQVLSSLWR